MMKKHAYILFAIALCSLTLIGSMQVTDELTGAWNYQVEQTAPQYSKGQIVFEQGEDEQYSGKIVFESGRVISLSSVTVEADTVTFKAYVDGGLVTTICTLEEDEMSGTVRTPEGMLPFSATKE
jgi:hypothetical protein